MRQALEEWTQAVAVSSPGGAVQESSSEGNPIEKYQSSPPYRGLAEAPGSTK